MLFVTCPITASPIRPILDMAVACFLHAYGTHQTRSMHRKFIQDGCNNVLLRTLFGSCYS